MNFSIVIRMALNLPTYMSLCYSLFRAHVCCNDLLDILTHICWLIKIKNTSKLLVKKHALLRLCIFKLDLPRWCTNRFRDHSRAVPFSDFRSKQETAG